MPYILVRGNLASYSHSHRYPWRVLVSGLKGTTKILFFIILMFLREHYNYKQCTSQVFVISAVDIEQLSRFASGGYCDDSTIVYLQHPCVILSALEVLGYKVVASSSTSVKQDYNEYMWTMRKDFTEPEPEPVVKAGNPSKNFRLRSYVGSHVGSHVISHMNSYTKITFFGFLKKTNNNSTVFAKDKSMPHCNSTFDTKKLTKKLLIIRLFKSSTFVFITIEG